MTKHGDVVAVRLQGPGSKGHAIKYRMLGWEENDAIAFDAATALGAKAHGDGGLLRYQIMCQDFGWKRMVVAVTKHPVVPTLPAALEDGSQPPAEMPKLAKLPKEAWDKPGLPDLEMRAGVWFSAQDVSTLRAIYQQLHEVPRAMVEAIVGKAERMTEET